MLLDAFILSPLSLGHPGLIHLGKYSVTDNPNNPIPNIRIVVCLGNTLDLRPAAMIWIARIGLSVTLGKERVGPYPGVYPCIAALQDGEVAVASSESASFHVSKVILVLNGWWCKIDITAFNVANRAVVVASSKPALFCVG